MSDKRIRAPRLIELRDVRGQMAKLYAEHRADKLSDAKLNVLSQHLKRLSDVIKDIESHDELLEIKQRLDELGIE